MALSVPGRSGGPVAAINVTPMADVMIVLLVIFMVAIPALDRDTGLRLPPATQARSQRPEVNALTLALRADGSVWLNGLPAPPPAELREQPADAGRGSVPGPQPCSSVERKGGQGGPPTQAAPLSVDASLALARPRQASLRAAPAACGPDTNTGSSRPVATTATAAALGLVGPGAEVLMGAASELGARSFVCLLGARPGRWALVD